MGKLMRKLFNKKKTGKPGDALSPSSVLTGLPIGDRGSNVGGGGGRGQTRVPGRRNPRTALGPEGNRL